jgi:hypothetical protein
MNDTDKNGHDGAGHGGQSGMGRGPGFFVFLALCIALLAVDLIHHRHVVHPWERLIGFYGFYGFVACVVLVLVARALRRVLMRPEDYYDGR